MTHTLPDSFGQDSSIVGTAERGQRAHQALIEFAGGFERKLWAPREGVYTLVGNGLSNQTFVRGPQGWIVIDTGDSVQEMRSALKAFRAVESGPIVAIIYSHFHYIGGTQAVLEDTGGREVPIWAHARVAGNKVRIGADLSPTASRGIVHQFAVMLPEEGEDGHLTCGLGPWFRNPEHAPHTAGDLPATQTFEVDTVAQIAGLETHLLPAPSDSNDSITIWFPALQTVVHNIVWPVLFNVFAIRGEEYRDPRVLLKGIDQIRDLAPEHLICVHGLPLSGKAKILKEVTLYRDSIQYLWDQTVRGINNGLAGAELAHSVQMPEVFNQGLLTRQFYGLAEHHVRQIQNGLIGWFDGEPEHLFPLPPADRARRLIAGFGGAQAVRDQAEQAITNEDWRWALELAGWLVRANAAGGEASAAAGEAAQADRNRLALIFRAIGQRTTSANLRNWCITRARTLEGKLDLSRFYRHHIREAESAHGDARNFVAVLRVMLDPVKAAGVDAELAWVFESGERCGLRVRHHVGIPTAGDQADATLSLTRAVWSRVLAGRDTLRDAIARGEAQMAGDLAKATALLRALDRAEFDPGQQS